MFYRMDELLGSDFRHAIVYFLDHPKSYRDNQKDPNKKYSGRLAVEAITSSDFAIGGSTEFHAPFEETMKSAAEYINYVKTLSSGFSSRNFGSQFSTSTNETVAFYKGNQKPKFSVNVAFISTESKVGERAIDKALKLLRAVYSDVIEGGLMKAPLGYHVNLGSKVKTKTASGLAKGLIPQNTITVEIGNYAKLTGQVITEVNLTLSKQTIRDGTPLFVSGTVNFEPAKMISYRDLQNYFGGGTTESEFSKPTITDSFANISGKIKGILS